MTASGLVITRTAETSLDGKPVKLAEGMSRYNRFEDCVECGICISACPTMAASDRFFGPAALAGIFRARQETSNRPDKVRLLELADGEHGVWRCHTGWECSDACPQAVNPAEAIMSLRRDLIVHRFKKLFGK